MLHPVHGSVQVIEDLEAAGGVQSVGVGDQAETGRSIRRSPSEALRAAIVVDGHAHPGERGDVVVRSPGSGEVEVEEADRLSIAEDHVLQADVVVADDGSPFGSAISSLQGPPADPAFSEAAWNVATSLVTDTRASSDWAQDGKGGIGTSPSMNTSRSRPSPWISTGNDAPWNPVDRVTSGTGGPTPSGNSMGGGRIHRSGRPGRHWRRHRPGTRPHAQYPKECPGRTCPRAVRLRRSSGLGSAKGRRQEMRRMAASCRRGPGHHPAYAAGAVTGLTTTTHRRRRESPDPATLPRFRPRRRVAGGPSREPHRLRSRHTRPRCPGDEARCPSSRSRS